MGKITRSLNEPYQQDFDLFHEILMDDLDLLQSVKGVVTRATLKDLLIR